MVELLLVVSFPPFPGSRGSHRRSERERPKLVVDAPLIGAAALHDPRRRRVTMKGEEESYY